MTVESILKSETLIRLYTCVGYLVYVSLHIFEFPSVELTDRNKK